jgi:hypothetical protein
MRLFYYSKLKQNTHTNLGGCSNCSEKLTFFLKIIQAKCKSGQFLILSSETRLNGDLSTLTPSLFKKDKN